MSTRPSARILLDVGSASVAGACALLVPERPPTLIYGKRVPITAHEGDTPEAALGRALGVLASALEGDGMSALARSAPGARADGAVIGLDAPWATTTVRVEEERPSGAHPFAFSSRLLADMLRRSERAVEHAPEDRVEQQVVGARLNGYQCADPVGKVAHRAALVILAARITGAQAAAITALMRERFQIRAPELASGAMLRYRALAALFPHERDVLILDAAGPAAALSLVRMRTLVAVREFAASGDAAAWVGAVAAALKALAESYPLPRTILLIADEAQASAGAAALAGGGLGALWFSDVPPRIVPVSRVAANAVALAPDMLPDIRLALMSLAIGLEG